jgi:hypothetical protein
MSPATDDSRKKIERNLRELEKDMNKFEEVLLRKPERRSSAKIYLQPLEPSPKAPTKSPMVHAAPSALPNNPIVQQPIESPVPVKEPYRPKERKHFLPESRAQPQPQLQGQPQPEAQAHSSSFKETLPSEADQPRDKEELHLLSKFRLKSKQNEQHSSIKDLMVLSEKSPPKNDRRQRQPVQGENDERMRQRRLNFLAERRNRLSLPDQADLQDPSLKGALARRAQASKAVDRKTKLRALLES